MHDGATDHRDRDAFAEQPVRVFLRPIATPLPLGFAGLAVATLTVSALQLGWVPIAEKPMVGWVLLAFPVGLQLIATIFGFLARDPVAATGVGILAGTWLATALVFLHAPSPTARSAAFGMLLLAAGTSLIVPIAASLQTKLLASIVLATAAARFFTTGAYEMHAGVAWKTASGWLGIALFAVAIVAAGAFELEDERHRKLPVTLRRGQAAAVFTSSLTREVPLVEREAGVREQL